jgi:DNA-binding MarR family transcriptional regulator
LSVNTEAVHIVDMMREFGAMALAGRLRRLSDRLKSEASRIYRANGIEFNDGWFPVALVLSGRESISVTQIAEAFGTSHAAVSQMITAMKNNGLVSVQQDKRDKRRTIVQLTDKGRSTIEALRPLWNAIGQCTEELTTLSGNKFVKAISDIENRLEKQSLFSRVAEYMKSDAVKNSSHQGSGQPLTGGEI